MNATSMMAFVAKSNALEDGVKRFLADVERREKTITDSIDYAWSRVNELNCDKVDTTTVAHYVDDVHDYEIILNELKMVKRELQKILEGEE